MIENRKGRIPVSGFRLFNLGLRGCFRNAPAGINSDTKWLDKRQYRRLERAEKAIKAAL